MAEAMVTFGDIAETRNAVYRRISQLSEYHDDPVTAWCEEVGLDREALEEFCAQDMAQSNPMPPAATQMVGIQIGYELARRRFAHA